MSSPTKPSRNPRRVPRGTLNPDVIVQAAIGLITAEGLEDLTMRRLADDLGVQPMSLYTHFRNKDALLLAVSDKLFRRFEMPEDAPSDLEMLRGIMRAHFRLLIDHPVLLQLGTTGWDTNPPQLHITESMYRSLKGLGVDHRSAVGLLAVLMRFVIGSAYVNPVRRAWDDASHWDKIRQLWTALPSDVYPSMHEIAGDLPEFTQQEVFELGLETLLNAVTEAAEETTNPARPAPTRG